MTNKILFLCCAFLVAPALSHAMSRSARPGDIIKGSGPTQYYWDPTLPGYKVAIPDPFTLRVKYNNRGYISISDAELNNIHPGFPFPSEFKKLVDGASANGILLKGDSDPVYLVRNRAKQHVMDPPSLAALKQHGFGRGYGPAYNQFAGPDFLQVSDGEMSSIPDSASPPKEVCDRTDGSVIKGSGPTQYGIDPGGVLRAIPDPETLQALFPGKQCEQVSDACITYFNKKGPTYASVRR